MPDVVSAGRDNTRERLAEIPLIHLSDGSASTGIACAEAEAGLLPRRPTVVVGQQYLLDPARVPAGAAALWLQLQEVPYAPRGDAAGELNTADGWTKALAKGYANRVLDRVGLHAPDLYDKIRAVDVLTPDATTIPTRSTAMRTAAPPSSTIPLGSEIDT